MVNAREDQPLTRLEVLVLARLSAAKAPAPGELGETVHKLALPAESPARAREVALETLEVLRGRGLVNRPAKPHKTNLGDRSLTGDGQRMLRAEFGLASTPEWSDIRRNHLPALALGLKPNSEQAKKTIRDKDSIAVAVLATKLGIEHAHSVAELCDALIAKALGMPRGELTLQRIRAHVLAKQIDAEPKGKLEEVAARATAKVLEARPANKKGFAPALGRRWVCEAANVAGLKAPSVRPATHAEAETHKPPHVQELPAAQPPLVTQKPPVAQKPPVVHTPPAEPVPPVRATPPSPDTSAALLQVVRDAIANVGEEGRFGDEKVFVSALWHNMDRDRRLGGITLERFKRWLVKANRDGALVLARADLAGGMDTKLVADSEIEDHGATFHFVLDPRRSVTASERGTHVR